MEKEKYLSLEYQNCHQKMKCAVNDLIRIEVYVFLAVSAIYVWVYGVVLSHPVASNSIRMGVYVPPVLICFACYRSTMQIIYIETIRDYLILLEKDLSGSREGDLVWEYVGWESWSKNKNIKFWNWVYRILLWFGFFVASALMAYFKVGMP